MYKRNAELWDYNKDDFDVNIDCHNYHDILVKLLEELLEYKEKYD